MKDSVQDGAIKMKLYRVILPVKNIDQATLFYTKLTGDGGTRVSPGRHYFNCDGVILACYDPVADGDPVGPKTIQHMHQYLYFSVSDLAAMKQCVIEAGGTITADIETMPWGECLFYATDPFGNQIAVTDQRTVYLGPE